MDTQKSIPVSELVETLCAEMHRLGYKPTLYDQHMCELRKFEKYCRQKGIQEYRNGEGIAYFRMQYGFDINDSSVKFTNMQCHTRKTVQLLDDIFYFGRAQRHCFKGYNLPSEYASLLDGYLDNCLKNKGTEGTNRVKCTKLKHFFSYLDERQISLEQVTPSVLSDYIVTLTGYSRSTIHIFSSVLKTFLRYLEEEGAFNVNLSGSVPKPKIYGEETIPETWTVDEIRRLLVAIDRTNAIGKRDYAMILLAVMLGMRAGDICALRFCEIDWRKKQITYTQQKTRKVNTLPLLSPIGDAIIDYIQNGRLDSKSDHIFIRHIPPYDEIQSSSVLTLCIKRYMRYAGLQVKNRKGAHALRHTLASNLLTEGVPLMTISNVLGHSNPHTTAGYLKVNIPALRKCALFYGKKVAVK